MLTTGYVLARQSRAAIRAGSAAAAAAAAKRKASARGNAGECCVQELRQCALRQERMCQLPPAYGV